MIAAMWRVREHRELGKRYRKLPSAVRNKYELWKNLVFRHGPEILRTFPGFHDEKLKGVRTGQRSSPLSLQYRVMYQVDDRELIVYVLGITPHQY